MSLLTSLLRTILSGESLRASSDWNKTDADHAMSQARANKLGLIVAQGLAQKSLSNDLQSTLSADRIEVSLVNGQLLHLAAGVSDIFNQANIRHVFFKGPMQQKVLHNDFFRKPALDIDVLVPRADFKAARRALLNAGFTIPPSRASLWWTFFLGEQPFKRNGGNSPSVDLHHRLQQPGCPTPRRLDYFFENTETIKLGSRSLVTASPSAIALICSMNLLKAVYHREPSGSYAFDLITALTKMEAAEINKLLEDAHILYLEKTLVWATSFAAHEFEMTGPFHTQSEQWMEQYIKIAGCLLDPDNHLDKFPKRRRLLSQLIDRPFPGLILEYSRWGLSEIARLYA